MSKTALDILRQHRPEGMPCHEISKAMAASGHPTSRSAVEHWLSGRRRISLYAFDSFARVFPIPEADAQFARLLIRADLEARSGARDSRSKDAAGAVQAGA